jgi:hypothetical protein
MLRGTWQSISSWSNIIEKNNGPGNYRAPHEISQLDQVPRRKEGGGGSNVFPSKTNLGGETKMVSHPTEIPQFVLG